ncbi:hypothetical protein HX37_22960 [Salmonella enterica]|uniref:Uncharacterized protein n=2 Tax=Salmonella enterica TaxID=28901 RepID=A0A5U2FAH9_SALER|nr:hypothetical protein [Salmonella enterica]EDP2157836.1 hypothetical protein [Salmonella enterica subsp. enterica serovar Kisarawe]EDS6473763.1 hypothetical protein [Salmonella enterica subsp. enterica]EAT8299371.1 hypothetical protein [Salmonella enterica]EAW4242514.1 hypothetical protein [Salmonella enterica]EBE0450137.1 hypothetical protein [Salmonella enterica]
MFRGAIKRNRYRLRRAVYRSREYIGWLIIMFFCFLLWFVNHENQRLQGEIDETRAALAERQRRIVELREVNRRAIAQYHTLESQQRVIISMLKGEEDEHQRQGCGAH